ncbi:MAG: ribonuclease HII [Psychroflexus sp.]|uniref:ribonuclease HII n=1 Tax=Psychroflexus sp. S27 TaxID=1982757 RepID=UPI000C2A8A5C|nr:ribonuclease HII [Psychroflexus sp. S27]PJX20192.1 ribonuclease HII [Psychroflexus sp. S27]
MLKLQFQNQLIECGTDEAGRGCLSGPVTAAAVILPVNFKNDLLNDSKQLNEKKRLILREIIQREAVAYAVAHVMMDEIDKINILNASILAMHKAVEKLKPQPEFIAVDGNKFKPYKDLKHQCVVKGDAKYMNIAAASVLAKTARDDFMQKISEEFPVYDWHKNKGYPTQAHRKAILEYGSTKYHRQSFKLLPEQLKMEF